jgi:hypothetical protein
MFVVYTLGYAVGLQSLVCSSRRCHAPAAVSSQQEDARSALLASLQGECAALPERAAAAIEELQKQTDGSALVDDWLEDAGPSGRWRMISCDALLATLAPLGAPIADLRRCAVELGSEASGAFGQQRRMSLELHVNAGADPDEACTLRLNGIAAMDLDGDEVGGADVNIVLLSAELLPVGDGGRGLALCEAALVPKLPPGALRAKVRLVWLDGGVCVARYGRDGGAVVLKRVDAMAAATVGGDEELESEPIWVGSPY